MSTSLGTSTPARGPITLARVGLALGIVAFALVAFLPSALHEVPGKGDRPAYAAAVGVLMAVWWFTEALPIAWTAAVPLVAYPLLGVLTPADAARPYVDPYIFLFLGGMSIGAAMEQWNLHRRVALRIMLAVGTRPRRLLAGLLLATAAVSMWISNTATAVMMVPIGMALLAELEAGEGREMPRFGAALMLGVAYAANVGGIGSKIGTATNSIFAGFLSERLGQDLSFVRFMAIGLPFVLLFLPVIWLVLWRRARVDAPSAQRGRMVIARQLASMGRMDRGESTVAWVFGAAALLWILGDPLRGLFHVSGKRYEAVVAMSAALALLWSRTLSLASLRRIPWGTLVLLGGSFALAAGIEQSGLSDFLASRFAGLPRLPLIQQLAITSAAAVFLSAFASNTATISVLLNVLPPSLPVLSAATLASSCDFALPAGTPPNAIVFGSGRIRLPVMMRTGLVLDLLAVAAITLYGAVWIRWLV